MFRLTTHSIEYSSTLSGYLSTSSFPIPISIGKNSIYSTLPWHTRFRYARFSDDTKLTLHHSFTPLAPVAPEHAPPNCDSSSKSHSSVVQLKSPFLHVHSHNLHYEWPVSTRQLFNFISRGSRSSSSSTSS